MKFTDPVGAQLNLSEMLQILGNGYYFDPLIYTCMHSFKVFNVITFIAFEGTEKHLKISPKLQIQNLDQTLCSKSEQKSNFMNKLQPHQHVSQDKRQQQKQPQLLSWHHHTPVSHQKVF